MTRPRSRLSTRRAAKAALAGAALAAVLAGCGAVRVASAPSGTAKGGQPTAAASARRGGTGPANGAAASPAGGAAARPGAADGGATSRAAAPGGQQSGSAPGLTSPATMAQDSPAGFWYGTDSWPVTLAGGAPYREPDAGGPHPYGGYIGMAGNWARWAGCGGTIAWSAADAAAANANYTTYHQGVGTGAYWFMAGPGVDPHYNGTAAEARAWGAAQAAETLRLLPALPVTYRVIWMDVELPGQAPGYTPAQDNGWDNVYTSPCSGTIKSPGVAPAVDRAVLDGYQAYLTAHSGYLPGVYSSPLIWAQIFGTGPAAAIPDLYEWTYTDGTSRIAPAPRGWCIPGTSTCARFFGGVTGPSPHALMWQWSGGGGITNGVGDFDQIRTTIIR